MTTKTSKPKTLCQVCQGVHDWAAELDAARPEDQRVGVSVRVTTAKWRVVHRDGVRFQQQLDLCAKHWADVLDRITKQAGTVGVDLNITRLR